MILKVGITGGIGSGKSTVARIFEVLGIPVYYADPEAKRLMNEDLSLKARIITLFGSDAYVEGALNRAYIAAQVFGNKQQLEQLNAIVHPATIRHSNEWMQRQTTPYAIKEAALIFESSVHMYLDYVIGVSAPINLRLQRVAERDGTSIGQVQKRMQSQMTEEEKMQRCNSVIVNDGLQAVLPQVLSLHNQLLQLAHQQTAKE